MPNFQHQVSTGLKLSKALEEAQVHNGTKSSTISDVSKQLHPLTTLSLLMDDETSLRLRVSDRGCSGRHLLRTTKLANVVILYTYYCAECSITPSAMP